MVARDHQGATTAAAAGRPSVVGLCVEPLARSLCLVGVAFAAGPWGPRIAAMAVAGLASALVCAWIARRCYAIEATAGGVHVAGDLTGRSSLDVPIDQIACVAIDQGPLGLLLGYGDLEVATTSGTTLAMPCITGASAIRDALILHLRPGPIP